MLLRCVMSQLAAEYQGGVRTHLPKRAGTGLLPAFERQTTLTLRVKRAAPEVTAPRPPARSWAAQRAPISWLALESDVSASPRQGRGFKRYGR